MEDIKFGHWSCDMDNIIILRLSHLKHAPYEIQLVLRKMIFQFNKRLRATTLAERSWVNHDICWLSILNGLCLIRLNTSSGVLPRLRFCTI